MVEVHLKPIPQTLFPTKPSLAEAVEYLNSQLPIRNSNELHAVLMLYQNTLLNVQAQSTTEE